MNSARLFVPELVTLPIAPRRCVVYNNALGSASLELSAGEHAVLTACAGWRTLAEHEARAAAHLSAPPEHRAAIRELLERCARQRLLLPVDELVARFGSPSSAEPSAFGGAVVRTADRPRMLARLLASAEALEARGARKQRWLVIDDSHDNANEQANRAAIANASTLEIRHYDRAAADAFQEELIAEFPRAAREIAWLLGAESADEATPGRPLNHALLQTAGCAFVGFDDDTELEPRRPALADQGFAVSDELDALTWYRSEESLLRHCPPADVDPIAQHAQWLGMPMADAWARAEKEHGSLAAMDTTPALASRFAPDARIIFTRNHSCGDPGSNALPLNLFSLPARSRQWLAANPEAAEYAFEERINWRGQAQLRFAPGWQMTVTTIAGFDNSRLLPPTTRGHRSTDLLLGAVTHWIHRSAWQVDMPFGLPHRREPTKHWLRAGDQVAPEPLSFILAHVTRSEAASIAAEPAQRLAAVGALLLDLAATGDRQLAEMLLQHAMEIASGALFAIHEQLDDATLPAAWKQRLAAWLGSPALALDDASARARVPSVTTMRSLIEAYGRALLVWRELWDFCRERNR